jgi:hypothetical protein
MLVHWRERSGEPWALGMTLTLPGLETGRLLARNVGEASTEARNSNELAGSGLRVGVVKIPH